jgi:hypothetical protein
LPNNTSSSFSSSHPHSPTPSSLPDASLAPAARADGFGGSGGVAHDSLVDASNLLQPIERFSAPRRAHVEVLEGFQLTMPETVPDLTSPVANVDLGKAHAMAAQ